MMTGIKDALEQPLEKQSPVLGRNAVYQQTSRISRLPASVPDLPRLGLRS